MKKVLIAFVAVLAVTALAATVQAAPPQTGEVPDAVLADLGMAGMERVSDAQGEQIRGKWYFSKLPGSYAARVWERLGIYTVLFPAFYPATPSIDVTPVSAPWDVNYGPIAENVFQRNWRNYVNFVNDFYGALYPAGIGPYGPGGIPVVP